MRKDYQSATYVTNADIKKYLYTLSKDEKLWDMMSIYSFKKWFNQEEIKQYYYKLALKELYKSENYDQMEYHLIMMNTLFSYQSFQEVKDSLLKKLLKKEIGMNDYCIIRHLIPFNKTSFISLIDYFFNHLGLTPIKCARICLLEDQSQLAYHYLSLLDGCDDEYVLDVLCAQRFTLYVSLMKHYKQRKAYRFAISH